MAGKKEWPSLEAPSQYSVGWIAALPHERAAALVMLDERHNKPNGFVKNRSDTNSYSWGRIAEHNVVIASLPVGEYGLASAAHTAGGLLSSLPHIRVGLFVGIGAGLPSKVLLGDVVVSNPDGSNGGVVQYDLVKAKKVENGARSKYERKGFLNSPPQVLRHGLGALQAEHEVSGSEIGTIMEAYRQNENMRVPYGFPGADRDPLRRDSANPRTSSAIHYGTIASGNTLIKNSLDRDDLVAWLHEDNINPLCFEMEAAGLMNSFPCLVIRGICDYADEHKNDDWQRYAAATAAAFAKELLGYIDVQEVEEAAKVGDLLANLSLKPGLHDDEGAVPTTGLFDSLSSQATSLTDLPQLDNLHAWLKPPPFKQELNRVLDRRVRDSQTRLSDQAIADWLLNNRSLLQITGYSGCGKTTLAADIIEYLSSDAATGEFVGYAFCLGLTINDVLHGILWQLVRYRHLTKPQKVLILDAYRDRESLDTHRPSERQFTLTLRKVVVNILNLCQSVVLVLDGVDQAISPEDFMACISTMSDSLLSQGQSFKLLVTSRQPVRGLQRLIDQVGLQSLSITAVGVMSDARLFLQKSLRSLDPPLPGAADALGMSNCVLKAAEGWPYFMHALATKYVQLSRPNEAEVLVLETLSYREARQLPTSEPILQSKRLLGWIMTEQGRRSEALVLQRALLDLSLRTKGAEDESTRVCTNDLSITLIHRDATPEEVEEGIMWLETIVDAWKTPEGFETEQSLAIKNNLGTAYMEVGRFEDAEALLGKVLQESVALHGENSPASLDHKSNLAQLYARQERWAEAEVLDLEVLDARKRTLGVSHLATIQCMSSLGWAYSRQGRLQEAKALQLEVLENRMRLQGPSHPDTIGILGNLAETVSKLGEMADARRYARLALGY